MDMKKRILSLLLATTMCGVLLASCGGSADPTTPGGDDTTKGQGQTDDTNLPGEAIELTALITSHPLTKSIDEMEWVAEVEKSVGVNVTWEQIYTDWDTTKPTRFAAKDIPDLLFAATSTSDYATYSGLFMELTELIDEHAPNVQRMFEEQPDTYVLATQLDGKIYATPKYQGKWPETNTVMFINQDWLNNLSLDTPTTFTELKEVLTAFKDGDPNGNGDNSDEVPMDFNGWFGGAYSLTVLMGSLGVQITNWGWDSYFAEDGEIKAYAVDERYKLLMEYLADLYAGGLINPNAITNDYSMFQSLSRGDENGNALVGVTFGWEETDKFGPDLAEQYVALAPLEYDINTSSGTYDTRWNHDFAGLNMDGNRVSMSAQASDPEAAMKFIDAFYNPEVSVQVLFGGIADGNVEKVSDTEFNVLPPQDEDTDPGTWKWASTMADGGPMYIPEAVTINMQYDMENALREREVYKDTLAKMTDDEYYPQGFMKYTQDQQSTLSLNQANINDIINNYWALWLTGESDIKADWDSYVDSVYAAGLQDVLDVRQEAFDTYRAG